MIVSISGKAGSGKDTIGDYLVKERGFKKIALADPIKRLVKDVFVLDDETVYDRKKREEPLEKWNGWTVRKLLQFIGTELFRKNIDEAIWVKSLLYTIEKDKEHDYVISDARFKNEIENLKEYAKDDFLSIKVIRDGYVGEVGIIGHESEKYDLETDVVIENNGTFEDLYRKIDEIIPKRRKT